LFGNFPDVCEVARQTDRAGEDRDRQARNRLVGLERDAEECMESSNQTTGKHCNKERYENGEPGGPANVL